MFWHFFLSTLNILVWCCHFLFIRLAPDISESWQPFLLTALKPETWRTLLSWLFWCHRCLLKPTSFQPLSIDVSFSCHPYLLASLFLETSSLDTLFFPHPILLTRFLYYFVLQILHKVLPSTTSYYKACTKITSQYYFLLQILRKVLSSTTSYSKAFTKYTSQYYFVLQSLHKILPSTPSYYKACTKYFPVLLRATKLAQSTSQYYFFLQSLHKLFLPGTTSHYKACTKYFPVLLRTIKLAQKVLPSTSSCYKACAEYFPVLLRTTKLAQSTSPHDFVPQSLHEALPRSTSYCKACTKYFSVISLRTTRKHGFRSVSNVQSNSTVIYKHCLANHTTTTSATAAINNMDVAIPVRSASLNSTLQWRTHLGANEIKPHPWHRQGSPHRRWEPLCFVRFLQSKRHPDTAVPLRSAITALQITMELRQPTQQLEAWMQPFCNSRSPDPMAQRSRWAGWPSWKSPLQCRKPCKPTFVTPERRLHPSHRRGAISTIQTSPWHSNSSSPDPMAQRSPSAWPSWKSPLPWRKQCEPTFVTPERQPHPLHRRGSHHGRQEPVSSRKRRVWCDFYSPNITLTQQFHYDLRSLPCKSHYNCIGHLSALHLSALFTSGLSHIPTLSHPYSVHLQFLRIPTLSISNLCASLLSPSPISPHLYSLHL